MKSVPKSRAESHAKRVLVAFDFAPSSIDALRRAIEVASRHEHAEVHVLHPVSRTSQGGPWVTHQLASHVSDAVRTCCDDGEPRVVTHYRSGPMEATLPRLLLELDASLIVLSEGDLEGARGRALQRALERERCPVMVAGSADMRAGQNATPEAG